MNFNVMKFQFKITSEKYLYLIMKYINYRVSKIYCEFQCYNLFAVYLYYAFDKLTITTNKIITRVLRFFQWKITVSN